MLDTVRNLLSLLLKRKQPHRAVITSVPPTNEKIETLSPSCFVFMYTADNWASKMALQWTCCRAIHKAHSTADTWSARGAMWLRDDHKQHLLRFLNMHALHCCEKCKCMETTDLPHGNMWRKKDARTGISKFSNLLNTVGIFKVYVWAWRLLSPISVDSNTGHYTTINVRQSPQTRLSTISCS